MSAPGLAEEIAAVEIPDIPLWSENFCFNGFDPERKVGFYFHLGRWSQDVSLWREQILIFPPDGSFLTHRSYGSRGPAADGVSGPGFDLRVPKPGRVLGLSYRGGACPATVEELSFLPLRSRAQVPVQFELEFEATGAIWDFGASLDSQEWASFHIEQPGRITGSLRCGGSEYEIAARGYRDHSRGPRDLSPLVGSHWGQGHFPSGRSFALVYLRTRDEEVVEETMAQAMVFEDGRLHPASVRGVPYLVSPFDRPSSSYTLEIESDLGLMEVEARVGAQLPVTADRRWECYDGIDPAIGVQGVYEGPTVFSWNGEQGAGWTERGSSLTTPR